MNNTPNPVRILSEYFAAILVEGGDVEMDRIQFWPEGEASATIYSDILEVTTLEDGHCAIRTARPSPADGFPDHFFHTPGEKAPLASADLEVWRAESQARDAFFQLLMHELDVLRLKELLQLREDLLWADYSLCSLWGVPSALTQRQQAALAEWMPQLRVIMGNFDGIARCLSAVLNVPVAIVVEEQERIAVDDTLCQRRLGCCTVGKEALLGLESTAHWQCLKVLVGPVPPEELCAWQPGFQKRQAIEALYDWLFSATTTVNTQLCVQQDSTRLPTVGTAGATIGYFTVSSSIE